MALLADLPIPLEPMTPVRFRVRANTQELPDTFTLELEPPGGHFAFLPGQFTMLYVFGIGEVPISLSGDPSRPDRLIQTIRGVGAVTRALRNLQPGDVVGVRGPFGTSWPVDSAEGKDVIFVAGGIGLAPLRPAIYAVLAERDRFGRVVILYGARNPDELLYAAELQEWRGQLDLDVLVTVDNAGRDWHGSVGVVTKLIGRAPFDPRGAVGFVCGPEIMMRFTAQELATRGVPSEEIHLSMERNMKCGIGLCGHCQHGARFVCKDGPVFNHPELAPALLLKEV